MIILISSHIMEYITKKNEFNLEFKLTQKEINDIKYLLNNKYNKFDF